MDRLKEFRTFFGDWPRQAEMIPFMWAAPLMWASPQSRNFHPTSGEDFRAVFPVQSKIQLRLEQHRVGQPKIAFWESGSHIAPGPKVGRVPTTGI